MAIISKFINGIIFKGGILAAGVICMYLTKTQYLPRYIYPISYGMTSVGILGLIVGLGDIMYEDEDNDPGFEDRMAEFYRLKPMLEERLREQGRLLLEYEKTKRKWIQIDALERDSFRFEDRISAYESRMAKGPELPAPEGRVLRRRKYHSAKDDRKRLDDSQFKYRKKLRSSSLDNKNRKKSSKFYSLF